MKKHFNPQEWLNNNYSEVDKVITRIEAELTDITANYSDWLTVGFAFAVEFGETGRKFYHRTSRFYPDYTKNNTDKQYDHCLKAHGHGITIKTFFYLAKQAGIDINTNEAGKEVGSDQCSVGSSSSPLAVGSDQCSVNSKPSPSTDSATADKQSLSPSALPTLPDALFDHLPRFLKRLVEKKIYSN